MSDETDLSDWIGRQHRFPTDRLTPRSIASFAALLGPHLAQVEGVPVGIHWCLAPVIAPQAELGPDGHLLKGGLLPPVPQPRRMWAGGEVSFLADLRPEDTIDKQSTIEDITWKSSRSGPLCFVTLRNSYVTPRGPAIVERQNIVYREAATGPAPEAVPDPVRPGPALRWQVPVDAVTLFRYSALTFNSHRIHYDVDHARTVEHYPGLVIHGPLQAVLLLNLAVTLNGRLPQRFAYRGTSPACAPQTLDCLAWEEGVGLDLAVRSETGVTTMTGRAEW